MEPNRDKWSQIEPNGDKWSQMEPNTFVTRQFVEFIKYIFKFTFIPFIVFKNKQYNRFI